MSNIEATQRAPAVLTTGAVDRWRNRWQEAQHDATWVEAT